MIDYLENIEVLNVKLVPEKPISLKKIPISFPDINISGKVKDEENKNEETVIPFDKWIMPPQPEGYIKPLLYDCL